MAWLEICAVEKTFHLLQDEIWGNILKISGSLPKSADDSPVRFLIPLSSDSLDSYNLKSFIRLRRIVGKANQLSRVRLITHQKRHCTARTSLTTRVSFCNCCLGSPACPVSARSEVVSKDRHDVQSAGCS